MTNRIEVRQEGNYERPNNTNLANKSLYVQKCKLNLLDKKMRKICRIPVITSSKSILLLVSKFIYREK